MSCNRGRLSTRNERYLQYDISLGYLQCDIQMVVKHLLDASECHLGALDVLLWAREVVAQGLCCPRHARSLVRNCVPVVRRLPRLTSDHAVQARSLLVGAALVAGVAGGALGLEDLGARLSLSVVGSRHDCKFCAQSKVAEKFRAAGKLLCSLEACTCQPPTDRLTPNSVRRSAQAAEHVRNKFAGPPPPAACQCDPRQASNLFLSSGYKAGRRSRGARG